MALIHNGSNQLSGINRMFGAVGASGLRSVFERGGVRKNFDSGQHAVAGVTNKAAMPSGVRHPLAWKMGTKAGSMATANDISMGFAPTASGALGVNGIASIPMSLDFSQAAMGLVSQGIASITFNITLPTPSVRGALSGSANVAGLNFSVNPTLGAKSGLAVSMPMTITMLPSIQAKGSISATITNEGAAVTPTSVAAEVWNTVAASFNLAGTMGNKMNSAASAGDPWGTLIPASYGAGTAGQILGTMLADVNGHTDASLAPFAVFLRRFAFYSAVHVDSINGASGTAYPLGTPTTPVDNLADARVIAAGLGLKELHLTGPFVLDDAFDGFKLVGNTGFTADSVDLNHKVLTSCVLENMTITGTLGAGSDSANVFRDCYLNNTYQMKGEVQQGRIENDCHIYPGAALSTVQPIIEGDFTVIDLAGATGTVFSGDIASGSIVFTNAVAGSLIELNIAGGDITLDATCTGGEYWIEGYGVLYNESAMTLKGDQLISLGSIADGVWVKTLP